MRVSHPSPDIRVHIRLQVKLAFYDDRKSRELVDRRMKEQREIRAAAPLRGEGADSPEPSSPRQMPGHGHVLIPAAPGEGEDDSPPFHLPSNRSARC
jgi:hypothetical protein